jgi:hypothetical protein
MDGPFRVLRISEKTDEILKHPKEFALLALIAERARRTDSEIAGLKMRESLVGDFEAVGLTRQEYRTALLNLEKWGCITSKATNKGTIVTLLNDDIWDLQVGIANQRVTIDQPTGNQRVTTNHKDIRIKGEKEIIKTKDISPGFRQVTNTWFSEFKGKYGMNPPFTGQDGATLKRIHGDMKEETVRLIHQFFISQDQFILQAGHSTNVFCKVLEKLIKELKQGSGDKYELSLI